MLLLPVGRSTARVSSYLAVFDSHVVFIKLRIIIFYIISCCLQERLSDDLILRWGRHSTLVDEQYAQLSVPGPNPFIPEDFTLSHVGDKVSLRIGASLI